MDCTNVTSRDDDLKQGLSPEAAELADSLVRSIFQDERRQLRYLGLSTLVVLSLWVYVARCVPISEDSTGGPLVFYVVGGFFVAFSWLLICGVAQTWFEQLTGWKRIPTRKREALRALAKVDDPRYVGSLMEVVASLDETAVGEDAYDATRDSLARNLNRIGSADQLWLTRGQTNSLRAVMTHYSDFILNEGDGEFTYGPVGHPRSAFDETLSLACLHTYRYLSDPKALLHITRLAESDPLGNHVAAWRVVNLAREVLPILKKQILRDDLAAGQALLHPASAAPPPNSLLRPTRTESGEVDSDSLLRIVNENSQ